MRPQSQAKNHQTHTSMSPMRMASRTICGMTSYRYSRSSASNLVWQVGGGGNRNGAGNDGGVTEGKVHRSAIPSSNCHNLIPSNLGALMPVVESNVALVGQLVALAAAVLLKRKTVLDHTTLAGAWLKGKG